jgi:hypothetical protein
MDTELKIITEWVDDLVLWHGVTGREEVADEQQK